MGNEEATMRWFVSGDAGVCGTSFADIFDADSLQDAEIIGREIAIDWARSYFEVYDANGPDGDEEYLDEEYVQYSDWVYEEDINWSVEPYNPNEHDGQL